jgi:hypothetical protein
MKKKLKKLRLTKETLVNLEAGNLALGGAYTYTRLPGGTETCYCTVGFSCQCSQSCQICVPF